MAGQPVFVAAAPTSDPNGPAASNAGYAAVAAQRAQDLAEALAAMGGPATDTGASNALGDDPLAQALLQQRYGPTAQGFAQAAGAEPPWIPQPAQTGLDELSRGEIADFAPESPTPQSDMSPGGEVRFDDLIPNRGPPWLPAASGAWAGYSAQTDGDASPGQTAQPVSQSADALISSRLWRAGMADEVDTVDFGGVGSQGAPPATAPSDPYGGGRPADPAPAPTWVSGGPAAAGQFSTPQFIDAPASPLTGLVGDAAASSGWSGDSFPSLSSGPFDLSADLNGAHPAELMSSAAVSPGWGPMSSSGGYDPNIGAFAAPRALPPGTFTLPSSLEPVGLWNPDVQPLLLAGAGSNGGPPWVGLGPIQSEGLPGPNSGAPVGFEPLGGRPGQDGPEVVEGIPGYNHGNLWYPNQPKLPDGTPWPTINPADPQTLSYFLHRLSTDNSAYTRNITIYAPMSGKFRLPLLWSDTPSAC